MAILAKFTEQVVPIKLCSQFEELLLLFPLNVPPPRQAHFLLFGLRCLRERYSPGFLAHFQLDSPVFLYLSIQSTYRGLFPVKMRLSAR